MSADADRLDALLADYLQAVEAGHAPNRAENLRRHPDLSGELAAYFADEDRFRQVISPRAAPAENTVTYTGPPPAVPNAASRAQPVGQHFGGYEIIEPIAAGGMGEVFRARQTGLNRIVAVKMLRGGRLASTAVSARRPSASAAWTIRTSSRSTMSVKSMASRTSP
jgi:hypothetical protein